MSGWVRGPKNNKLVRSKPHPKLKPDPKPQLELKVQEMAQGKSLSDIFYPPEVSLPSCFTIPNLGLNVTFKLRPHYSQTLPKFASLENAYLFFREFEEVCSMMHFPNISIDVVRMKLIPFVLKDSGKCWVHGLAANYVTSWNDFVTLFLRKYFPNAKIVKIRNEINQSMQLDRESFFKYFGRFKNLLVQCPHHGLD